MAIYTQSDLKFTSSGQSIYGTGTGGVGPSDTNRYTHTWGSGTTNVDAFIKDYEITGPIRVKAPFFGKTLFTIPAVTLPISSGLKYNNTTSGEIGIETRTNFTLGSIDSALTFDATANFVDNFRSSQSGQQFDFVPSGRL